MSYPPCTYEFFDDTHQSLYVGKANAGQLHNRITDHIKNQRQWFTDGTWIRYTQHHDLTGLPANAAGTILLNREHQRIGRAKPKGNKVLNGKHHDRVWMQQAKARAVRRGPGITRPSVYAELVMSWLVLEVYRLRAALIVVGVWLVLLMAPFAAVYALAVTS